MGPKKFYNTATAAQTRCCILKNLNKSVILKNVAKEISEADLTELLSNTYENPTVTRFRTRSGQTLTTVKIYFQSVPMELCTIMRSSKQKSTYQEEE